MDNLSPGPDNGCPGGVQFGPFRSLRSRMMMPLISIALLAAILVAIASYWLAHRAVMVQVEQRFAAIHRAIQQTNFPLTKGVLSTLGELTAAHWITMSVDGKVIDATFASEDPFWASGERLQWRQRLENIPVCNPHPNRDTLDGGVSSSTLLPMEGRTYRAKRFRVTTGFRRASRGGGPEDRRSVAPSQTGQSSVAEVVVLLDDAAWSELRFQATAAPLAAGISTILLIGTAAVGLTGRLVHRLERLEKQVGRIALGDFTSHLDLGPHDELNRLGEAVQRMGAQLQQMMDTLGQQHGQRLLHQIAGGLAHNLRNCLTGARMAVELHAREDHRNATGQTLKDDSLEGMRIAIEQLDQAERYVSRLLLVSKGKQDVDRPALVRDCMDGIRGSLENTARHLNVELDWEVVTIAGEQTVRDGPTLVAAVTNLVWNGLQAGQRVSVRVVVGSPPGGNQAASGRWVRIEVSDDGAGPAAEVASTLFEPLVTTKPEGLGLGLPLVKRAAQTLSGEVSWERSQEHTVFTFLFPVHE